MKDEAQLVRKTLMRSCGRPGFLRIAAAITLTLGIAGSAQATSGISMFANSGTPQNPLVTISAATVGVKFRSDMAGNITALRFYKGAGNNGNHIGLLYNSSGQIVVQAPFTNETVSGWQQVDLPTPQPINAN